jgi:hypothetical protein
MDLLAHPFRVTAGGRLATVVDGSDEAHAEALADVVLTHLGERELLPDYGITDPAFAGVNVAQINACLDRYGPPIAVVDAATSYPTDTTARTVLTFEEAG